MLAVDLNVFELRAQVALDIAAIIATEPYLLVEFGHAGFHLVDEHRLEGAVVHPMAAGADEVVVGAARARGGVLHQQAGTTQAADDGALEVMIVRTLPLAVGMSGQDVLHRLPGGGVHERLVRPGVLHALEGDDALVVGVTQQRLQESDRDRVSRFAGSWWDGEAAVVEVLRQLPHRPVTRRILREGEADERCPLLIQGNGADFSAVFIPGADIHIPQRCLAQCPAVSGFLSHPLDDLIGQVTGVELSNTAHDAVQQHAARGLVDVLGRRHQPHTCLLEGPVDLHIVRPIAGQPIQLVDDDIVNPTIFLEVGQHLLQLRPVSRAGGLAPVGKLLDHQRTHRLSLALIRFPLSWQGEALLRSAALSLLTGRDADV
nr:hypothetical protein [uncultured Rothia sp.]